MKPPLEHLAWKHAAEAGVGLPDELLALYERVERLEGEQAQTIAEAVKTTDAVDALLGGKSLSQAIEAASASADVEAELTERRRVALRLSVVHVTPFPPGWPVTVSC